MRVPCETQVVFRIYTETRPNLADIVSAFFAGFTVFNGVGYWENERESSTVIEVIATVPSGETDHDVARSQVLELAERIRTANGQTAVFVTETKALLWKVQA